MRIWPVRTLNSFRMAIFDGCTIGKDAYYDTGGRFDRRVDCTVSIYREAAGSSETSLSIYRTTYLHIPEGHILNLFQNVMFRLRSTRYGMDGPEIESWWGARFSAPVQTDPGAHSATSTMGTGSSRGGMGGGGEAAGAWHWPPTPSSVEVKERVEFYICSLSGPSWPVLGWT